MKKGQFILDRISDSATLYLKGNSEKYGEVKNVLSGDSEPAMDFWALYRVDEITFEDKAPRKEALENVVSSMNIEGVNFVYIILGSTDGVQFYYGIAKDYGVLGENRLEINDIGGNILKPSLQGNFRGSVITEVNADERKSILKRIDAFTNVSILEGVPGINKDDEKFQSVDRVIDVMLGEEFALMVIAKPVKGTEISRIQEDMYHLYNVIAPISKSSVQENSSKSTGTSESQTTGRSETKGESSSKSTQEGTSTSTSHTSGTTSGTNKGVTRNKTTEKTSEGGSEGSHEDKSFSDSKSESESKSSSTTSGNSTSTSNSTSETKAVQSGNNTGSATTIEVVHKKVQDWIKYMDEVVFPRLDYGLGKGLFVTSTVLLGNYPASIIKLENTLRSIYGGEAGNRMPLRAFEIAKDQKEAKILKRMQVPELVLQNSIGKDEEEVRTACSQFYVDSGKVLLGNWMSSQEISLLTSLPQKEVVGLALREEVEFGLNVDSQHASKIQSAEKKADTKSEGKPDDSHPNNPIHLGHLVQSGVVLDGKVGAARIPVFFNKSNFDKHIFVTGVTGGGKTTTCQRLLLESGYPYLVIEPAKTEYRALLESDENILAFTLGKETAAPFRLNPFEFFKGENITSRVDMIKASLEAAFDMEAAIPQLFETAIYECYEDKGWNISTNKNYKYPEPFSDGVFSFPTLGDLERKIDKVVRDQGFDDRLRDEYIGSMRARLKGLTIGSKGLMLNTPRSVDFVELLDKKVILELEYIKSGSEKSLIMGFILSNLSEAIKVKYNQKNSAIRHITLIEEAHRLLSKYMPGDSMNKKQGVEMFSDMLAEVRKYGESLIIADQIPNKLTPEVLKNTNTKIVHKIFAQDDKEAIGNTMALKDEQKEHLSYLTAGRAVMIMPGLSKAIQVQVTKTAENDTERPTLTDEILRERIIKYYRGVYLKGILPGLEMLEKEPDEKLVRLYLDYLQPQSQLVEEYYMCIHEYKVPEGLVSELKLLKEEGNDLNTVSRLLCCFCHKSKELVNRPEIFSCVEEILENILKEGKEYSVKNYKDWWLLDGTLQKGVC